MIAAYRHRIAYPALHLAAIVLFAGCAAATILHYTGASPGNDVMWLAWLLALAAYTGSFIPRRPRLPGSPEIVRSELVLAVGVLTLYLVTHLWNFGIAPWNTSGLFDDAAWDIYFARNHAFNGPFQPAFFDDVGVISRETIFHYYITSFFKLFGYNLLVFNVSLLVLGFVTALFTTLTVHRLFRKPAITVASAFVINLLPLHFLHVFVGHRYAIAAPLMMVSLYFLYSGFQERSFARAALSGIFAGLCLGSAIMGKQVILALAATAVVLPVIDWARFKSAENRAVGLGWLGAFLIAATPLLIYIAFHPVEYFRREQGLLTEFVQLYTGQGYDGVRPFVDQLGELFFARDTSRRMWLHDFPMVPPAYWLLLIPGLVIAVLRRRLELVGLSIIPVLSALLSGAFDFRVLLAAPVWVVVMAFTLDVAGLGQSWSANGGSARPRPARWRPLGSLAAVLVVALGVVPSAVYLIGVSGNSRAQYLLPHRDVAVSRLIQDVVAGAPAPSEALKDNEFDRPEARADRPFDALACAERAYATAHLYLQAFDDRRVLSLCDNANQALAGKDKLPGVIAKGIAGYEPRGKGLKVILEESAVSRDAISRLAQLERYGSSQRLTGQVDGETFSIWVLSLAADSVAGFQAAVARTIGTAP